MKSKKFRLAMKRKYVNEKEVKFQFEDTPKAVRVSKSDKKRKKRRLQFGSPVNEGNLQSDEELRENNLAGDDPGQAPLNISTFVKSEKKKKKRKLQFGSAVNEENLQPNEELREINLAGDDPEQKLVNISKFASGDAKSEKKKNRKFQFHSEEENVTFQSDSEFREMIFDDTPEETLENIAAFISNDPVSGHNNEMNSPNEPNAVQPEESLHPTAFDEFETTPISYSESKKINRQTVMEAKVDKLEKNLEYLSNEIKEIKEILKIRKHTSKRKGQIAAYCKEACVFPLLPKFKLKKVRQVVEMEENIHDHREYKEQIAEKMSLIGGKTIKQIVINIFKKMFTTKLKTKFTWTGFAKGTRKEAFQKFEGIISVIQIAVSAHYDCTIADIEEECKLRLKQAQKDYDREKSKKSLEKQRQRNEKESLDQMIEGE